VTPKVSVIVATYCAAPEDLDRLIASIDAQTLADPDLETVFVDDGSPDDTWQALQKIAAGRPNVVIDRIEHSGWPSRPRNAGVDLASGEWVIFTDQDDALFPDGLRAAVEYATKHDLDVVTLKEIESALPGHILGAFMHDRAGERSELGIDTMLPMQPHKLYRRERMLAEGVRFREYDGGRVMWEDIHYNIDAFVAARRIGTLGNVCVYHHIVHDTNASML
jgi:glycosyltransferase involved in cell wall biosynthesis